MRRSNLTKRIAQKSMMRKRLELVRAGRRLEAEQRRRPNLYLVQTRTGSTVLTIDNHRTI